MCRRTAVAPELFFCQACGIDLCKTCWLFFDGPQEPFEGTTTDLDPFPELIIEVEELDLEDEAFQDAFSDGETGQPD